MRQIPFMQVDAFTRQPFSGNACAVVLNANDLDEARMQAIAREFNQSETAFVQTSDVADYSVRYFTPDEEIPMAGHPTIATAHALVASGRFPLNGEVTSLHLSLQVGVIRVNLNAPFGRLERIDMFQKKPVFSQKYDPQIVMPVFGLKSDDLLAGAVIQTVSTGTSQLMVPLADLQTLRRAQLDISAYQTLRRNGDFFSPHLFCLEGFDQGGQTSARHFGTPPDIFEDPFTGSATGGMAAYLWHYGYLQDAEFIAQQGHDLKRPGQAEVGLVGTKDDIEAVRVSGYAVKVMEGHLWV